MITAIVLAGGRSSRFGEDKLGVDVGGRSMLAATVAAVAPLADGVAVAGPSLFDADLGDTPVALFRDREPFGGPLRGLANVLDHAIPTPGHLAVVVGGDMPAIVPAVLVRMLDILDVDPSVDAVLLGRPDERESAVDAGGGAHRRQALPLALRIDRAAAAAREAVAAGDRSLQALVDRLAHVELPAAAWLPLDPAGRTIFDVDTPADLDRLRAP